MIAGPVGTGDGGSGGKRAGGGIVSGVGGPDGLSEPRSSGAPSDESKEAPRAMRRVAGDGGETGPEPKLERCGGAEGWGGAELDCSWIRRSLSSASASSAVEASTGIAAAEASGNRGWC
jgi:hypothetical protein